MMQTSEGNLCSAIQSKALFMTTEPKILVLVPVSQTRGTIWFRHVDSKMSKGVSHSLDSGAL